MNSLNLLSSRVIGQSILGPRPRSRSQGEILRKEPSEETLRGRSYSHEKLPLLGKDSQSGPRKPIKSEAGTEAVDSFIKNEDDEKQPIREVEPQTEVSAGMSNWKRILKRMVDALTVILAAIGAPVVYVASHFKKEDGRFTFIPRRVRRQRPVSGSTARAVGLSSVSNDESWSAEKPKDHALQDAKSRHSYSSDSMTSTATDSDSDRRGIRKTRASTRIKREPGANENNEPRRSSIRIKEQNDPALKKRKQKRHDNPARDQTQLTVDNIKSPTSPSLSLKVTRYPHAPQPPRPMIPRRQPSYSNLIPRSPNRSSSIHQQQKTLVLDLDETLIHSLAKGGRMSSGHMVEVKLNIPVAVATSHPNQATQVIGPYHPILYYVHKRPHCDEFLRKVCKWYKLVIFTASVQEYADPVIDWLEQERKYFAGRYYRQHCTFRNGAYIKDLSSVEPDLSKVIILDNSPVSYIFHEDNAIPIEGWINDPTDNDLLHLIPMLEALQYVTDVRALLALRRGEVEAS